MTETAFREHSRLVNYWVRRYAYLLAYRPEIDREDLFQAGACGMIEAEKTYEPEKGTWGGWASFYIRKNILNALGMRKHMPESPVVSLDAPAYADDAEMSLLETLPDPNAPDMDGDIMRREVVETVRQAVDDLEADERDAVRLHCLEGRSVEACVEIMGARPVSVQTLCKRGRRALRKDKRLLALMDFEARTPYMKPKGVTAFFSTRCSAVEDAVLWRERERARLRLDAEKGDML